MPSTEGMGYVVSVFPPESIIDYPLNAFLAGTNAKAAEFAL